jgi:hypothetical protein
MEMDLYKSRISDGVLVQKQNRTSRCLKLNASASQFFGTKCTFPHTWAQGGSPFFQNFHFFGVRLGLDCYMQRIRAS